MTKRGDSTHTPKRAAFTLIELLVVIAIIGLLSTIAVVSMGSARMNARNSRKVADNHALSNVLNLAFNDNAAYPDSGAGWSGGWVCISKTCTGSWSPAPSYTSTFLTYIAALPSIPSNATTSMDGYLYNSHWSGGTAPFDGRVFSSGVYLAYFLESATPCNQGQIWLRDSTGTECLLQFN
jgi:prepilin-type N-terminal cleavage/methylation domain-containing protein